MEGDHPGPSPFWGLQGSLARRGDSGDPEGLGEDWAPCSRSRGLLRLVQKHSQRNVKSIRVNFHGAGLSNEIRASVRFNLLSLDIRLRKTIPQSCFCHDGDEFGKILLRNVLFLLCLDNLGARF